MAEDADAPVEGANPPADQAAPAVVDPPAVGAPKTEPKGEPKGDFPDDWRERLAGGDEKKLAQLKRYSSLATWSEAGFAARQKISSGEYKRALAADAPEEEIKAWRAENGIPAEPGEYLKHLPDGLAIGDAEKPLYDKYLAQMHGLNADPKTVAGSIAAFKAIEEDILAAQVAADRTFWTGAEDALRSEWGGEYRANINVYSNFLDSLPDGLGKMIQADARFADGTKLKDHPAFIKAMVGLALELNPAGTVVPAGTDQAKTIEDELASIKATMGDPSSPYNRDGGKTQGRYLQLLEARDRMKSRAA